MRPQDPVTPGSERSDRQGGGSAPDDLITRLLKRHREGDREAFERLMPEIYDRLRRIARGQLARWQPAQSLSTRTLVHEAYLQLVDETGVEWRDRAHFFAVSARTMRRLIVDHARRSHALKRGGEARMVTLDRVDLSRPEEAELVLAVDEALAELEKVSPELARIVEYRFFAGMTERETATEMGLSLRTLQRSWARARGLLRMTLESEAESGH